MAEGIKKISENVIIDNRALVVTNNLVADNRAINIGALWSDPTERSLKIKIGDNSFSYFDAPKILISGSILTELLKDKCVTEIKMGDLSVSERTIQTDAVTTIKIKNLNVTELKLANQSVSSIKIKDLNVLNKHLADNSITNIKVLDKTLTGEKIADKSLESINYNDNSIVSRVIADSSLLERHYSNKSIPSRALQDSSVYGTIIKELGVDYSHLADNSVLTRTLANGSVNGLKIKDLSILAKHLNQNIIGNIHLTVDSVNEKNLMTDSVTTIKVKDKSITKSKLADDIVDLIGDPVQYDEDNNVNLRKDLNVAGNVEVVGNIRANKIFNAVFMDLAEAYVPEKDTVTIPGDIVQVNENGKIVKASPSSNNPIVGVISDEYAACYGATEDELLLGDKVAVGLIGKVHVNVVGPVKLGDKIAVAKDGAGASYNTNNLLEDHIIGKALESNDEVGLKKVLCLIYPR